MNVLRDYQKSAVASVFLEWETHNSTLIVCPTGTGKTQIFCDIISKMLPQRTMVLAHRGELITQAVKRLWDFEIDAEIEMADLWANESSWNRGAVVVSTVQTQVAGQNGNGRMSRFNPMDFGLVVADEAHHYTAKSFSKVLDYYRQGNPELKLLGVTATPDRADEEALGQVFESVAFVYEILDSINDGWLVPVEQQMVSIGGLDFSSVRTTAGDLNGADLAAIMEAEENLHGIASSAIDIIGGRQTLVFTVTVKQAERLSEIFNRHKPDMADWVCGATPKDKRHETLTKFKRRATQVLVNVGVLTEGFDDPNVAVIVQARPTKSRCLYAQIIGRALRPLPGIADKYGTANERKQAIAESDKPSALILDFVGNAGKHKLMTTADILGGKVSDEAMELVIAQAKKDGKAVRMDKALESAENTIRAEEEARRLRDAARRANVLAKAQFSLRTVSPFDVLHLEPAREVGWNTGKQISEKQRSLLLKAGINPTGMPYAQAQQLVVAQIQRWSNKLCSLKQAALLHKHGYADAHNFGFKEAGKLIDQLARNGWKRR